MPAAFEFPLRGRLLNARPADVYVPMGYTTLEKQGRTMMYKNTAVLGLTPAS